INFKLLNLKIYYRHKNLSTYLSLILALCGGISEQNVSAETKLTATFSITYEPGVLKAIALQNGVPVDSVILQTAGKATKIKLTADRNIIRTSRNDLSYVTAEILDTNGQLVPDAVLPLHFDIKGVGEIIATANANPSDMESFQQPQHKTFRGKCLIIVRPNGKGGTIKLNATGEGLKMGEVAIESK
ncbi:MAG: hypothetical protein ACRDE5_19290, partial [Ginsengibacter sp.]